MKFYWFFRHYDTNVDLSEFILGLKEAGFDGALFAYANFGDPFTAISRKMTPGLDFEHIVAVRPWLISPQYLSNIIKSFNEISPGCLSINFVPGYTETDGRKGKGGINTSGILGEINDSSSPEDRRAYLEKFINCFVESNKEDTKIYVSGHHPDINKISEKYADAHIMNYHAYSQIKPKGIRQKQLYISMSPIIEGSPDKVFEDNLLVSSEDLINIINRLKDDGVEGILFHNGQIDQLDQLKNIVKLYKETLL